MSDKFKEAFLKYGRHLERCNGFPATSEAGVAKNCDCGYQKLREEAHHVGCYCPKDKCMAPIIMGRQMPCLREAR